jgi:glutamate-1-semialdehyde aminotransferase
MAAVIGRAKVMGAAQRSFISSTYWTEGIGPTAALATIRKLRRENGPVHFKRIGTLLRDGLARCAERHGLRLIIAGRSPIPILGLDYGEQSQAVYTLYLQEMLDRGFLGSKVIYLTLAHQPRHIALFLCAADEVFPILVEAVEKGEVHKRLRGPVAHVGFRRLT